MAGDAKLAVLIDADNTRPVVAQALLAEVAKYGTAHVKRAYGDWTGPNLKGWKEQLLARSIQPVQQFAYTTSKNATDTAMVIDAWTCSTPATSTASASSPATATSPASRRGCGSPG